MSIPEPVKRIVRQNSGFGCCKCGIPIIEYHHIVKGSNNPNDIMLLCPNHHYEATVEAMTLEEQKKLQADPINIKNGFVEGYLKVNHSVPVFQVGNCVYIGDGEFILVDGESLLSFSVKDGKLFLSMKCYDENDTLIAEIKDNEWISGNPLPWDLESRFQSLKIRRKLRDIQLEIDVKRFPMKIRADFWRKNQNISVNQNGIFINGVVKNSGFSNLGFVGMRIFIDTVEKKASLDLDPRFERAKMISGLTRENILNGINYWKTTTCDHNFEEILERKKYTVLKCTKCQKIKKIWK